MAGALFSRADAGALTTLRKRALRTSFPVPVLSISGLVVRQQSRAGILNPTWTACGPRYNRTSLEEHEGKESMYLYNRYLGLKQVPI